VTWTVASGSKGLVTFQGATLTAVAPPPAQQPPAQQPPAQQPPASASPTIWPSTAAPTLASSTDTASVEVGVKFTSDVSGLVGGIRFYKGSANTGTHVGSLWSASGQLLAQATFTNETATGWQQVTFSPPVAISANTVYVASYHAPSGGYADDAGFFTNAGVDNGSLHALKDGVSGGNGVYAYGTSPTFPSQTYQGTNYWVDVVFKPTTSLWSDSTTPAVAAASDTSAAELGVKFKSDANGYIGGIRFYKGSTNTGVHVASLWSSSGQLLAQVQFSAESASGWQTVMFASPVAITANTTYVASYHTNVGNYAVNNNYFSSGVDQAPLHALADGVSGGNGVYAYSSSPAFPSSTYQASNYWVDVIFTQ
jgi:hypothetical protein